MSTIYIFFVLFVFFYMKISYMSEFKDHIGFCFYQSFMLVCIWFKMSGI